MDRGNLGRDHAVGLDRGLAGEGVDPGIYRLGPTAGPRRRRCLHHRLRPRHRSLPARLDFYC